MKYISESQYNRQLKEIQRHNESKKRQENLKIEQDKYKKKVKLPTTSKLMALYLFIVLNVVLLYSMVAMWHFSDLNYLGVLITDVASQVLTYFIYSKKATIQNSVGGITYDMAMKEFEAKANSNSVEHNNVNTESTLG